MTSSLSVRMCRCCASKGTFKDIHTKYQWMGDEEVYADMLKDCLDINLSVPEDSENGGICEVCITQLRNASNFKKQVLNTEELFKIHLQSKTFRSQVKCEELELPDSIESEDDNLHDSTFEAPQEYEVLIKEETEDIKPKKQQSAKASTSRKKAKVEGSDAPSKSRSRTTIIRIQPRPTLGLKLVSLKAKPLWKRDENKMAHNLLNILLNSNASLIRHKDSNGYLCVFCAKKFLLPPQLKKHCLDEHNDDKLIKYMLTKLHGRVIKVDITHLNCTLCVADIPSLDLLVRHLKHAHNKNVYTDIKNHFLPFRFDTSELQCVVCSTAFSTFKLLLEHMSIHFRNFICDICDSGFTIKSQLVRHINRHKTGEYKCDKCDKVFANHLKRREHEKRIHMGQGHRNLCKFCDKRFKDYWKKVAHMVQDHGMPPIVLNCNACDRSFDNQRALARHTKKYHLMEKKHKCSECEMTFFSSGGLQKHMIKHTGLRKFQCEVCSKWYGRKNTLKEHMRIHTNDRRFVCVHCKQAFVQKCSWRSHMRSKHNDAV